MITNIFVEDPASKGGWLALENPSGGLSLHADTFGTTTMTMKRITATNVYVPGTYTVRATPDNVEEVVGVYIYEEDEALRDDKFDYLVGLFARASYSIVKQSDRGSKMLTAQAADWTRNTQREFMHGSITLVTFRVPILPYSRKVEL